MPVCVSRPGFDRLMRDAAAGRIDEAYDRIEADQRCGVWISLIPREEARQRAVQLAGEGPAGHSISTRAPPGPPPDR